MFNCMIYAHMVLQFDWGESARLARVHNNQMAHQRVWVSLRFCSWWRAGGADTALIAVAIAAGFAVRARVQPVVGKTSPLLLCLEDRKSFILNCGMSCAHMVLQFDWG